VRLLAPLTYKKETVIITGPNPTDSNQHYVTVHKLYIQPD